MVAQEIRCVNLRAPTKIRASELRKVRRSLQHHPCRSIVHNANHIEQVLCYPARREYCTCSCRLLPAANVSQITRASAQTSTPPVILIITTTMPESCYACSMLPRTASNSRWTDSSQKGQPQGSRGRFERDSSHATISLRPTKLGKCLSTTSDGQQSTSRRRNDTVGEQNF